MQIEETGSGPDVALTNGHGSIDTQTQSHEPGSSIDSSAAIGRGNLTTNGFDSPTPSRSDLPSTQTKQPRSYTQTNGKASVTAAKGENGHAEEDLWSSILNSVKSSRAVPVKNVIMLGESKTGKSTLLSQLSSFSPSGFVSHQSGLEGTSFGEGGGTEKGEVLADLGLGYGYFDVGDEDGEEIVARVGVYQISSSNPAHLSLLPFALSAPADGLPMTSAQIVDQHASGSRLGKSSGGDGDVGMSSQFDANPRPSIEALRDSLFLITLDWEAPWTFLSQLVEWLDVMREVVEEAAGPREGNWSRERAVWDEMKEALESSIRRYSDPSGPVAPVMDGDEDEVGNTSSASAIVAVSNPNATNEDESGPLPEGCLIHNFGVPLIIVCTKADTIASLERERNFKEEQFDYIQQVLRTISLKYGAGLFYTAQSKPASYEVLRSYMLHHFFNPIGHNSAASGAFSFTHRASTVERDVLLVPAGWDSFGKIRALRDGFDCAGMANGWEWDAEMERLRRSRGLQRGSREAEEVADQQIDRRMLSGLVDGDRSGVESAVKLYEDIVEDWDASAPPLAMNSNRIKEPDDQAFLLQHYNNLQREPEGRGKLSRNSSAGQVPSPAIGSSKSVVGPMASSSLSLPSVERAMLERQQSDEGRVGKSSSSRKEGQGGREREREGGRSTPVHRSMTGVSSSGLQSPSLSSSDKGGGSRPTSPLGVNAGGAQTPKQSEVLHSFFQSLLKEKGPGNATGPGRSSGGRGSATGEREKKSGS